MYDGGKKIMKYLLQELMSKQIKKLIFHLHFELGKTRYAPLLLLLLMMEHTVLFSMTFVSKMEGLD